jgi:hypothetical protein
VTLAVSLGVNPIIYFLIDFSTSKKTQSLS